jgi:hypothetical protein
MPLLDLLLNLKDKKGYEYQAMLSMVRTYIDVTPPEKVVEEIGKITDPELLRYLLAAKPVKHVYDATVKRIQELMG